MSRSDKGILICPLLLNIAVKYKAIVTSIVKETGAVKKAFHYLARKMDSFIRFKVLGKYLEINITTAQGNKTFSFLFSHTTLRWLVKVDAVLKFIIVFLGEFIPLLDGLLIQIRLRSPPSPPPPPGIPDRSP